MGVPEASVHRGMVKCAGNGWERSQDVLGHMEPHVNSVTIMILFVRIKGGGWRPAWTDVNAAEAGGPWVDVCDRLFRWNTLPQSLVAAPVATGVWGGRSRMLRARWRWRWMDMRGEMRARRAVEVRGACTEAAVHDRLSIVACGEGFTRIGTLLAFGDARGFGAQSTDTK